ncbi:hypothetical protein FACS1894151_08580 [Spirochaetia bacterium]|nr:hypothetical protein FACS1894151_08580 [Spirochaetia bacterium]
MYVNNDPVNYLDLWGLDSVLLTKRDSVLTAGHSAHAIRSYDEYGNPQGYTVYEVGPTREDQHTVSSNYLDPSQALLAGLLGGSTIAGLSGIQTGVSVTGGITAIGSLVIGSNITPKVGVNRYEINNLDDLPDTYNRRIVFDTTYVQDKAIRDTSETLGENFGYYNVLTNNCIQYSANSLSAGGVVISNMPVIPNIEHSYILQHNSDIINRRYGD